jgi:general secretion pathway protein G
MLKRRKRLCVAAGIAIMLMLTLYVGRIQYRATIQHARESVLRSNLLAIRLVIDQYIDDKHQAPQSLQQLVDAGYFRELPVDPMTNSNSNWTPVVENIEISPGQTARGITDLHSSSSSISSDGTSYSAW